jgi:hypothetical protein
LAQQAPIANQAKPPGGEVVELSPFVVTSEADRGYVASNTLAGSRLNTSLRDVASPLEVFTKDFLDDIAATSVADAIRYHSHRTCELHSSPASVWAGPSSPIRSIRGAVSDSVF